MTTLLQTALEAIEIMTTDNTSEQAQAAAADARIKLMNAMTQVDFIAVPRAGTEPLMGLSLSEQEDAMAVEPVAHFNMAINETVGCIDYEYEKHNLKSGTPLYLRPPHRTQPSVPVLANDDEVICPSCCHQFRAIPVGVQQLMLNAGFEPPFKHPPQQAIQGEKT